MTSKILDRFGQPLQTVQKSTTLSQSLVGFSNGKRLFFGDGIYSFYSKNSVVFRGIDFLSSLGARLPFKIYSGENIVEGRFDSRFDLAYPNTTMTFNEILYQSLINYFYFGEAFIYIDLEFRTLKPLNPKHITNYNGTWRYSNGSEAFNISDDELIYIKRYNPDYIGKDCGDRGLSIIDVIKEDLTNDLAAQRYNTKYFENFGKIGGFFTSKNDVTTAAQMEMLAKQYSQIHSGADNAYKALALPGGIEYQELTQTMREMEYIESRREIRDKVLMTLGIHKAVVGATETANRSVTEEAVRTVWLHTLQPTLAMFQEKINQQLFRRYYPRYRMVWDYSSVPELKESMDTVLKQAEQMRNLGYTVNEINTYFDLGMPEITDPIGNMRLIPSNLVPTDDLLIEEDITVDDSTNEDDTKDFTALNKYIGSFEEKETKAISTSKYIRKYNKLTRTMEKKFAGKIGKFFSKELGKVLRYVHTQKSLNASESINKATVNSTTLLLGILDILGKNKNSLAEALEPVYNEASIGADTLAVETVGVTAEPTISSTVVASMTNKIKDISNHTYRMLRTQVNEGIEAGESIDEIATRIKGVYKTSASRSRIIARTEVQGVVNRTADERYRKEGVKKKIWKSAGDKTVRKTHKENDKLGVVDYNYVYPNNMTHPGASSGSASEVIQCRCVLVPIIS